MKSIRVFPAWKFYSQLIFVLFCSSATLCKNYEGNKGWLRVCNSAGNEAKDRHYEVEADKCPHGAWFSELLDEGCVCVNGAWSLSSSWCDDDYHIIYGKGHCFNLKKPLQKVSFLGHEEDSFKRMNFITKENGHVFQNFDDEFFMPYEHSRETNRTIIRIQPGSENDILLEIKNSLSPDEELYQRLFEASNNFGDEDETENENLICINPNLYKEEQYENLMIHKFNVGLKSIQVLEGCQKVINHKRNSAFEKEFMSTLKIRPGQAIHVKSGVIMESTHKCPASCKIVNRPTTSLAKMDSETRLIRHKRQAKGAKKAKPVIKGRKGKDAETEPPPTMSPNFEPLLLDREFSDDERDEMVNTANLRAVKQELNWLLDSVRPPTIDTKNWKLMQKVKEVFVKVCPKTETPSFLVNAMLRLFRLLYLNTRDFFPNGHMIEEEAQYDRINATLEACIADAHEFKFEYTDVKEEGKPCRKAEAEDDDDDDDGGNSTIVQYCPCTEQLDMLNVTFTLNLTGTPESFNLTGENLTMPEHLRFQLPADKQGENVTYYDFPTETVWKMISFVHFYCAKHFRFQGGDHSALMTKMEDFFNEDIIYRWTKPGRFADKVWQFLYSAFDLKKFASSVDSCVTGAKFVSEYPEWLNRPTLSMTRRKKRSLDTQKLWNGEAYCLEDPWDPINKLGVLSEDKCVDLNRY